jgi:hypothetical protein
VVESTAPCGRPESSGILAYTLAAVVKALKLQGICSLPLAAELVNANSTTVT